MKTTVPLRSLGLLLGLALLPATAAAQFNIDLDNPFSPPEGGGGAPSSAFGAAANQSGFWNAIVAAGPPTHQLRDLSGQLTGVIISGPTGGLGNGFNNPDLSGDYRLLMADGRSFDNNSWTFTFLPKGKYRLFTYAVSPSGNTAETAVTVPGSASLNPQFVTGPIPPMQFAFGITHSVHDILVTSGSFTVYVDRGPSAPAYLNGFQLVLLSRSRS